MFFQCFGLVLDKKNNFINPRLTPRRTVQSFTANILHTRYRRTVSLMAANRLVSCSLRGMPRNRANQMRLALLQTTAAPSVAPTIPLRRSYDVGGGGFNWAQSRRSYVGSSGDSTWAQFLEGGAKGVSGAVVHEGGRRVKISWVDGHESEFSLKWLRDHRAGAFNSHTKQREV